MLLCPNCTEKLEKDPRHGEGVWYCPDKDCRMIWFILDIPQPKGLLKTKNKTHLSTSG